MKTCRHVVKIAPALLGLLYLGACAATERETFAEPKSAELPAAASDYAVDIPTSDEPDSPPKPDPK